MIKEEINPILLTLVSVLKMRKGLKFLLRIYVTKQSRVKKIKVDK